MAAVPRCAVLLVPGLGTDRTWYDVGDTLALSLDESTVRELIAEVQH